MVLTVVPQMTSAMEAVVPAVVAAAASAALRPPTMPLHMAVTARLLSTQTAVTAVLAEVPATEAATDCQMRPSPADAALATKAVPPAVLRAAWLQRPIHAAAAS